MVKRILVIVSIVLASFVVIAGGAVGISYLSGGFNKEVIEITHLYFDKDDTTSVSKEVRTLEDIVSCIHFQPANATNRELVVSVVGNSNSNGTLAEVPETIKAGEDFTLKVNKDSKGNNIGGTVTLKITPKSEQPIAGVTLKAVVDVNIPDNSLYFSGSNSGKVTLQGKEFTLPISDQEQHIYLKSTLINAFYLQANNKNIKNVQVGYEYRDLNGNLYPNGTFDLTNILFNGYQDGQIPYITVAGKRNYYHKIPLLADKAGKITVTAKMHRTSEIEEVFKANNFDRLPSYLDGSLAFPGQSGEVSRKLDQYNDFINKYIKYFDTSLESYNFFKSKISYKGETSTGLVSLNNAGDVRESFKYIYATATAKINVTSIKLKDFTSTTTPREYDVFSSTVFSISGADTTTTVHSIVSNENGFGLNIATDNENAPGEMEEKAYLFDTLKVSPYLYLDAQNFSNSMVMTTYEDKPVIEWEGRTGKNAYEYFMVADFEGNTPIITNDSSSVIGYLLKLKNADEYISITEQMINSEKHWILNCNVPLPNADNAANDEVYKALYLGFSVSGISAQDSQMTEINSFSRVYVNYVGFEFNDRYQDNISLKEMSPNMVVNRTTVDDSGVTEQNKIATGRFEQAISINWDEVKYLSDTNGNAPSYTNVMYFAESKSNNIEGTQLSKIATVGKYKFQNFYNTNISMGNASEQSPYHQYLNADLVGERIPTMSRIGGVNQYTIQVLNADVNPVRVFAVVFLADKNGNPIDANGRKIVIDETNPDIAEEDYPALVVLNITDISTQININSYVENINYYTDLKTQETITFENTTSKVEYKGNFLNRNKLKYYRDETNELLDVSKINDFLKLKLLKDNLFTLYISNHELNSATELGQEADTSLEFTINVFNPANTGEQTQSTITLPYAVGTTHNRTLAFNQFCQEGAFTLITGSYVNAEMIDDKNYEVIYDSNNDAVSIKFLLNAVDLTNDIEAEGTNAQEYIISVDPENVGNIFCTSLKYSSSSGSGSGLLSTNPRENWITYTTNELQIEDVSLILDTIDLKMQNKLTAAYYQDGGLKFSVYNPDPTKQNYSQYELTLENGHIPYIVTTNLTIDGGEINKNVVDPSQAVLGEVDPKKDLASDEYYKNYENLAEYIAFYTSPTYQHTLPTYTNANGVVSFAEDWMFTNLYDGEVQEGICFGDKKFPVDINAKTVTINGYILDVVEMTKQEGESEITYYGLKIPKGTYFPQVGNGDALIYNERFPITTEQEGNASYIYDYFGGASLGKKILVNQYAELLLSNGEYVDYVTRNYIDDTTTGSSLTKDTPAAGDPVTKAMVNFIRGEELGQFSYNANGRYKLVGGEFVEIGNSECFGDTYDPVDVYIEDVHGEYKDMGGNDFILIGANEQYDGIRYRRETEYRYNAEGKGNFKLHKGSFKLITEENFKGDRYALSTIYVQDKNGRYYYNGTSYELVPTTGLAPEILRYSKKGATAYLLMTIPVMSGKYTFYKAIEYELVQEDILISSYNDTNTLNSALDPQVYTAGASYTIYLGNNKVNKQAWITGGAADSGTFFNTVTFDIINNSVDGVDCVINRDLNGNVESITLKIPNMATTTTFAIQMSYTFKGVQYNPTFHVRVEPNIEFAPRDGVSIENETYAINLGLNEFNKYEKDQPIYAKNDTGLLNEYFKTSGDTQIHAIDLIFDNLSSKYVTITNKDQYGQDIGYDRLVINSSYAEYDGSAIKYDEIVADIKLYLDADSIILPYKLKFKLIPQYVVDLTGLSNATNIIDGTNLYVEYIKLFKTTDAKGNMIQNAYLNSNNSEYSKYLITDLAKYVDIFTIAAGKESTGNNTQDQNDITATKKLLASETISNGIIKLENMPHEDSKLFLMVNYTEGNESDGITHTNYFTPTVKGVQIFYSESGKMTTGDNNAIVINDPKANITIYVDGSNNISDFIAPKFVDTTYNETMFAVLYQMNDDGSILVDDETKEKIIFYNMVPGYKYILVIVKGVNGTTGIPEMVVETNHTITVEIANVNIYKSASGQMTNGAAEDKTKVNYAQGGVTITIEMAAGMPNSIFNYIYVDKTIPNTNPNPTFYIVLFELGSDGKIVANATPVVEVETGKSYAMAVVQGVYDSSTTDLSKVKVSMIDYKVETVAKTTA